MDMTTIKFKIVLGLICPEQWERNPYTYDNRTFLFL